MYMYEYMTILCIQQVAKVLQQASWTVDNHNWFEPRGRACWGRKDSYVVHKSIVVFNCSACLLEDFCNLLYTVYTVFTNWSSIFLLKQEQRFLYRVFLSHHLLCCHDLKEIMRCDWWLPALDRIKKSILLVKITQYMYFSCSAASFPGDSEGGKV